MAIMKETVNFLNDTAVTLAAAGDYDEAIACLRKALLIEPHNGLMWFNLGLNYYAVNRSVDACSALYHAIKYTPHDADAWDTLGIVLQELGKTNEACEVFNQALNIATDNARIWNNYGTILFQKEDFVEARRAFETALSLDPHSYDALFNLRDTYVELNEHERAQTCSQLLAQHENETQHE